MTQRRCPPGGINSIRAGLAAAPPRRARRAFVPWPKAAEARRLSTLVGGRHQSCLLPVPGLPSIRAFPGLQSRAPRRATRSRARTPASEWRSWFALGAATLAMPASSAPYPAPATHPHTSPRAAMNPRRRQPPDSACCCRPGLHGFRVASASGSAGLFPGPAHWSGRV